MIDPTLNGLLTPTPQPIITTILTTTWLLEFVFYPSKKDKKPPQFKASYNSILTAILVSITTSILLTLTQTTTNTGQTLPLMRNTGILIFIVGLTIRYWALNTLGKNFNRTVKVKKKQKLVTTGPYKKTRHPSYLGLILIVISIPLILGQITGLIISTLLITTTLKWRMDYEEKTMEKALGNRYREWKKKRYRLIPPIY